MIFDLSTQPIVAMFGDESIVVQVRICRLDAVDFFELPRTERFAVIRNAGRLYVVQDFGHSLPAYTPEQTENAIAEAVNRARRAAHLPALTRNSQATLRDSVCAMAQQDRLTTRSMHDFAERYSVVSYTNMHPEVLPANATKMVENRNFKNVAVGACYARTDTYPSGVYWVGLLLY